MEKMKNRYTTDEQYENLLQLLKNEPSLLNNEDCRRSGPDREKFNKGWENITKQLNSLGGPNRDKRGWLEIWRYWKKRVEKKSLSGGQNLTQREQKIADLLKFHKDLASNSGQNESYERATLNEIQENLEKLNSAFNDNTQYQQKQWELKEKEFIMIEKQHQREEELFKKDIEIKNKTLEVRKIELEVLKKQLLN